jgi:hypothetical protein
VVYLPTFLQVISQYKDWAITGNIFISTPTLGKVKNPIAQVSER